MECWRLEIGFIYIELVLVGKFKVIVKGLVDCSLKEIWCSGVEEFCDVLDCYFFCEFGFVILGFEEENNDWREVGFEEFNYEVESVYLIRVGSCSLGEFVLEEVSLDINGYYDVFLDILFVGFVCEDGLV